VLVLTRRPARPAGRRAVTADDAPVVPGAV